MAASDSSFNAEGPTVVAFETINNNKQAIGVGVNGSACGVHGEGKQNPLGTRMAPQGTGVHGEGDQAGVIGHARIEPVPGREVCGVGVVGAAEGNRGGVFLTGSEARQTPQIEALVAQLSEQNTDGQVAQIHLVPLSFEENLPTDGLAGDLLARRGRGQEAELFFCVKSREAGSAAAWKRVNLVPV